MNDSLGVYVLGIFSTVGCYRIRVSETIQEKRMFRPKDGPSENGEVYAAGCSSKVHIFNASRRIGSLGRLSSSVSDAGSLY